jgi:hypothetical protein
MRTVFGMLVGAALVSMTPAALAQQGYSQSWSSSEMPGSNTGVDNVGNEGQFVISADRVMGVFVTRTSAEDLGTDKNTTIALLGNAGGGGLLPVASTLPRLALDYFVIDGLSVGGSLMYMRTSGEFEPEEGDSQDNATFSTVLVHPRVGYSYIIDETFAIWPRAGITWSQTKIEDEDGDETTLSSFAVSADVPLVISPFEHFAFLVGPFLDLGVSGNYETPTREIDTKQTAFGLAVGIAGYY